MPLVLEDGERFYSLQILISSHDTTKREYSVDDSGARRDRLH
jgi:hypothetical protein